MHTRLRYTTRTVVNSTLSDCDEPHWVLGASRHHAESISQKFLVGAAGNRPLMTRHTKLSDLGVLRSAGAVSTVATLLLPRADQHAARVVVWFLKLICGAGSSELVTVRV